MNINLIECVPNISEGRSQKIIDTIVNDMEDASISLVDILVANKK